MQRTCTEAPSEVALRAFAVGLDVSEYQDEPDWDQVAATGYTFVFLRSSAGKHVDTQFKRNWHEAHRVGLRVGVYHYFRAGSGGLAQAERMAEQIALVGGFQRGDLGPVLDLEEAGQKVDGEPLDPAFVLQEAEIFLAAVQKRTKWRPIVYSGVYAHWRLSQERPERGAAWNAYPLWLPSVGSCPRMPVNTAGEPFPWKRWTFWQYSHTGVVPGVHGAVDLNYFHGGEKDLARFANAQAPTRGGVALVTGVLVGGALAWRYLR